MQDWNKNYLGSLITSEKPLEASIEEFTNLIVLFVNNRICFVHLLRDRETETETERERERDIQTDRHTDRQTETERHKHRDRENEQVVIYNNK